MTLLTLGCKKFKKKERKGEESAPLNPVVISVAQSTVAICRIFVFIYQTA